MIEELFLAASNSGFKIVGCLLDDDASTHKALNEIFPEVEVVHCSNHASKAFYSNIHNIYESPCSCKKCKRLTLALLLPMQKSFSNLLSNSKSNIQYFQRNIINFPNHYSRP